MRKNNFLIIDSPRTKEQMVDIIKGIPEIEENDIKEDATVGDIMKLMFPKAEIEEGLLGPDGKEMVHMYMSSDEDETILHMHMEFTTDIWNNSPFKINGEE